MDESMANRRPVSQAEAELDLQFMESCDKAPLVELPRWFFRSTDVEIATFVADGDRTTKDAVLVNDGAYIYVNGKIVAFVAGSAWISTFHGDD